MNLSGTLSSTTGSISGSLSAEAGVSGALSAAITSHGVLTGRDSPDQHPIDAITNLDAELGYRPTAAMSNSEIQNILDS